MFGSTPRSFIGKNAGSDGFFLVNSLTGAGAFLGIATVGGAGTGVAVVAGAGGNASSLTLLIGDAPTGNGTVSVVVGGWANEETVYVGGPSLLQNAGTGQLTVRNDGILRTATLFVSKTGTITVTDTGTIGVGAGALGTEASVRVSEGGFLFGAGEIQGKVIVGSGGKISPENGGAPGVLTVSGDYQQDSGGTYAAEIGGTVAGTGFDQINVTGAATLGGNLSVRFVKGFTPVVGPDFSRLEIRLADRRVRHHFRAGSGGDLRELRCHGRDRRDHKRGHGRACHQQPDDGECRTRRSVQLSDRSDEFRE